MRNFTIYTCIIGYNGQMTGGALDITTIKADPTPIEALLRPTQELYNAYKLFSLRQQLDRKDISESQREDMLKLIKRIPQKTTPMSLYDFTQAYTALIRERVGENLPLFKSIFELDAVALACTCKPGIKHFCHKFVVQEILDNSARAYGRTVIYGGELNEHGLRYVPELSKTQVARKPYYSGETPYCDPNYFDDCEGDGHQLSLDRSASGSVW